MIPLLELARDTLRNLQTPDTSFKQRVSGVCANGHEHFFLSIYSRRAKIGKSAGICRRTNGDGLTCMSSITITRINY